MNNREYELKLNALKRKLDRAIDKKTEAQKKINEIHKEISEFLDSRMNELKGE